MSDYKPRTYNVDESTEKILEAWRIFFDKERPGARASASEVVRALVARAGMPPVATKAKRA